MTNFTFRGSILAELVSRTMFVGIIILFVYGGFSYYVSKETFNGEMGERLISIARLSAGGMNAQWIPFLTPDGRLYQKFRQMLSQTQKESHAKNIFIMDLDGRVLVDAQGIYQFKENNWLKDLDPEPFLKAKAGQATASILFPESDGGIYKIGYSPISGKNKEVIAVLGVEASAEFMDGLNQFARILFVFGLVCLALMGGLLYAFGRRFIAPIEELAWASQKVSDGDFSQRVPVTSNNEIGSLAFAFNEMTKRLQSHNEYILESMSNGLLVVDLKGIVITFNKAASSILGFSQSQVVGQPLEKTFMSYPSFLKVIQSVLLEKRSLIDTEVHLTGDEIKILRFRSTSLIGADSQILGTEILFTDETQLRQLENRIKTSEKMATIGELAAGIAHEIRNPLGAMKGFTEILQKRLKNNSEAREMVADIGTEIEILNKIVTNFLVFAKPTSVEAHEVELSDVIHGLMPLVEKEAESKQVKIVFEHSMPVLLYLDSEQFRRALLNIVLNAVQASPNKGAVKIIMGLWTREDLILQLEKWGLDSIHPDTTTNSWVSVSVQDSGPGLTHENLKKIFTPFFSTKTEGFGLGLSITKKIMESHGGDVGAVNLPEGGAFFVMILPVSQKETEKIQ
jgi:PAS domain S-box-containing protein